MLHILSVSGWAASPLRLAACIAACTAACKAARVGLGCSPTPIPSPSHPAPVQRERGAAAAQLAEAKARINEVLDQLAAERSQTAALKVRRGRCRGSFATAGKAGANESGAIPAAGRPWGCALYVLGL